MSSVSNTPPIRPDDFVEAGETNRKTRRKGKRKAEDTDTKVTSFKQTPKPSASANNDSSTSSLTEETDRSTRQFKRLKKTDTREEIPTLVKEKVAKVKEGPQPPVTKPPVTMTDLPPAATATSQAPATVAPLSSSSSSVSLPVRPTYMHPTQNMVDWDRFVEKAYKTIRENLQSPLFTPAQWYVVCLHNAFVSLDKNKPFAVEDFYMQMSQHPFFRRESQVKFYNEAGEKTQHIIPQEVIKRLDKLTIKAILSSYNFPEITNEFAALLGVPVERYHVMTSFVKDEILINELESYIYIYKYLNLETINELLTRSPFFSQENANRISELSKKIDSLEAERGRRMPYKEEFQKLVNKKQTIVPEAIVSKPIQKADEIVPKTTITQGISSKPIQIAEEIPPKTAAAEQTPPKKQINFDILSKKIEKIIAKEKIDSDENPSVKEQCYEILKLNRLSGEEAKTLFRKLSDNGQLIIARHLDNDPYFESMIEVLKERYNQLLSDNKNFKIFESKISNLTSTKYFIILQALQALQKDEHFFEKPSVTLPKKFNDLLFENPKYALQLLKNPKFKLLPETISKIAPERVDLFTENDKIFAQCVSILLTHPQANLKAFTTWLQKNLQLDLPETTLAIAKAATKIQKQNVLAEAIHWDSVNSFRQLYELWKDSPSCDINTMIDIAVKNRSPKCLSYLFSHFNIDVEKKESTAKEAARMGDANCLIAICKNKQDEAAKYLFAEFQPPLTRRKISNLESHLLRIFRFNPLDKAEQLIELYAKQLEKSSKEDFNAVYLRAKEKFLENAPFIARLKKTNDLLFLTQMYTKKLSNTDILAQDLEYAAFNRENLLNLLKDIDSITPSNQQFKALPKSSDRTQRAAALLEKISDIRYKKQLERSGDEVDFKILRQISFHTMVDDQYTWAMPLISSVAEFSKAADIEKKTKTYNLTYNSKTVNEVYFKPRPDLNEKENTVAQIWTNGALPVSMTWQAIEDTFETLMSYNLEKPRDNSITAKKNYEDKLTEFYSKAAELVWLIGNTQPMNRGSGTFAEMMLAIVHLKHGMNPPILKLDFPQLDVLDITFPLSDYKKFFTYFFEQNTIPEHLRRPNIEGSLRTQMEVLYKAIS